MQAVQDYVDSLPISETLKQELVSPPYLHAYRLYLNLPRYLAPVFPAVSEAQLDRLTIFSYLYFRFVVAVDDVLDAPLSSDAGSERLLQYLGLYETTVLGLSELLPAGGEFWQAFYVCKKQYIAANLREKHISRQREAFTEESFEELANGKSAVVYALVHALAVLAGDQQPVEDLINCLRGIHVGSQYLDDVEDFRQDARNGQFTYAHHLVDVFIDNHGLEARVAGEEYRFRYLYTSGTAGKLMQKGRAHYQASLAIAQRLGLDGLGQYLQAELDTFTEQLRATNALVQELRGDVLPATLVAGQVPAAVLM
ncbi:hypothetical protein [Hymenobacter jeollabukensis]|uniref:Uncharacterized protein n=1 Tax=Hymenobacter jeollabukensis TaxID=2025313 RepID=A0A5R8WIM5_9BACT|nr:hypothetical protein [Hymenobacter jeollabukensis]TLM88726.1 hypothetical protein FDY95_23105 [Hymenobacter jeollabukensis]